MLLRGGLKRRAMGMDQCLRIPSRNMMNVGERQ